VRAASLEVEGEAIELSVSIGCAEVVGGDSAEALLHRADTALYEAKSGGRDRFAVAGGAPAAVPAQMPDSTTTHA
jgi:PleD family two-component response regulator